MTLRIPKVRHGSYFPALVEPRRRTEKALLSVVQEAYVHGVSTRKVDDLVRALGIDGISRSKVSRICAALDERMEAFRNRPLTGEYPYVWLDATVVKVREGGRVVNMAAVVAVGVTSTGEREVLGFDVGAAESYGFWVSFLRGLASRGLAGVKLVISDAHVGLRQALSEVLAGASWQRCRVHFMRNLLGLVPRGVQELVGVDDPPDQEAARDQLELAGSLEGKYPKAADLLREAGEDVITHMAFPQAHWRRIHSTNVLERLHREIKRRCNVVGIFPNARSALRLIGAVLEEQQDEWLAVRRYFSLGSMAALYGSSPAGARSPRSGGPEGGDRRLARHNQRGGTLSTPKLTGRDSSRADPRVDRGRGQAHTNDSGSRGALAAPGRTGVHSRASSSVEEHPAYIRKARGSIPLSPSS